MSLWLRSTQTTEPLVRPAADQCLEPQANGLGIRPRARGRLGLLQEPLVDVERLLHTDENTILIWRTVP